MMRIAVLLLGMGVAAVGQPRLTNGRLEIRAVSGALDTVLKPLIAQQVQPAWIGYAVPIVPGDRQICELHTRDRVSVKLEGPTELHVLFRAENGQVTKIRAFTDDCELDAGGLTVYWLTGVAPSASLALLDAYLKDHRAAMHAISLHSDPAAVAYLLKYASPDSNLKVREQAFFWLAQTAGAQAVQAIRNAVDNDPELRVKEKAVFALSQLPKNEGVPLLIDVARNHRSAEVRKKAMFWLGQSKDPRALKFFEELLAR